MKLLDVLNIFKGKKKEAVKKQLAKGLAAQILARLGLAMTGPLGWIASTVLAKYLLKAGKWISVKAKYWYALAKNKMAFKRDEKRVENVNNTLQDGVTEQAQVDASLDLLNGK